MHCRKPDLRTLDRHQSPRAIKARIESNDVFAELALENGEVLTLVELPLRYPQGHEFPRRRERRVLSCMLGADLDRLRSLTGVKWTNDPDPDVIPSWVADMDFEPAPVIKQALQAVIDRGDFGYNSHARGQLLGAWADWQERHFGWRPPEDESAVFTATLNCLNLVVEFMTDPGDGIVVFTPIYHPFRAIINDNGRRVVDVPLTGPDWRFDADRFEAELDPGTKMVLWCNPHNPLGRMFDADEIAAFADVAERHDLMIISDEIWCDLTWQGDHRPLARDHPELGERIITLGSASKSFSVAGLRCAVAHIGDPRVRARFDELASHFIAAPNTLGAEASLAAWTQGQSWFDATKAQIAANRLHLAQRVADDLPGVTMTLPDATYLAWVDFSQTAIADDPAEILLERGKIASHGGAKFCPTANSFVRLNFATSPAILDQVVDRIATTLQEASS